MNDAIITAIKATPFAALFADMYNGLENVPREVSAPSSHFQSIPRLGQYATIVEIHDDRGNVGFGECFGLPDPALAAGLIEHVAALALIGQSLAPPPADVLCVLQRYFISLGHTAGTAMEVISGLDIALWDLRARAAGQSLAETLGGSAKPVECYLSPVPFTPSPGDTARHIESLVQDGVNAIKLKVGRTPDADLEHIRAARNAAAPDVRLMLDANTAYTRDEAAQVLAALQNLDIAWLEEPLDPRDIEGHAILADRYTTPLATGENAFTFPEFEQIITRGMVKIIQPNFTRAGGVSGALEIDRLCLELGAQLSPHGVYACIGLATALHFCSVAKSVHLIERNALSNPLRDTIGPDFRGSNVNRLYPPPGPGHGGAPNWSRADCYRINHEQANA